MHVPTVNCEYPYIVTVNSDLWIGHGFGTERGEMEKS